MELSLTPDIEQALVEQANRRGTTPEQLALEGLRQQFVYPLQNEPPAEGTGTLADFLGEYIGILHSDEYVPGGARMSENIGESFTSALVERRQQGRL